MTRVAEKTGLERTHLYRKLKQLGVDLSRNKRGGRCSHWTMQPARYNSPLGQVAQLVEQRIENPRVGGSIPPLATTSISDRAAARYCCSSNPISSLIT